MKHFIWTWVLLAILPLWACQEKTSPPGPLYLIRVGEEIFTIEDFKRAFEIAKIAYADESVADPETLAEVRNMLLNEMIEELILLKRAKEIQLEISDQELENAVWKIQKDYPEDSFEKMLIESAISISHWKDSLRRKLLKDRVIFEELEKSITVDNDEIKAFYESHFDKDFIRSEENEKEALILSQEIIRHVRKEKAKKQYPLWIKSLWTRYGVDVNVSAWSKIINDEF